MNQNTRNIAIWVIIVLFCLSLFNLYHGSSIRTTQSMDFSEFIAEVDSGRIQEVLIKGSQITGRFMDGRSFSTFTPSQDIGLVSRLMSHNVRIKAGPPEEASPSLFQIFLSWAPMLLLVGVWIFFLRQMNRGTGRVLGFGRSRARLADDKSKQVTFEDVAGIDEAKNELLEIVDFLKDTQKFQKLGGKIPKGVLLVGPPGTGKTLLARAIAGEAKVPFFSISGSDFVEMFVGVGASRVRDTFEQAKKNAPCILFIDEIDGLGRERGFGVGGGGDEREQTLNQLLVEMDGFEANEGIIIVAATNRPDILDPALLRPGRFDRRIVVPNPDIAGREKILKVHMRKIVVGEDIDAHVIARGTPGFSGADLANLVNEAAILAACRGETSVNMAAFESAKDKIIMGAERSSMVMSEDERTLTAYHEAGHAIVAFHSEASDPIHKVTITPRGMALGMVVRLPHRDSLSVSRNKLMGDLAVMMGGRIAEALIFGEGAVTTGASSDIKQATEVARRMVTEWGMSEKIGPIFYEMMQSKSFLHAPQAGFSEDTAQKIDEEVKRIVEDSYWHAYDLLRQYQAQLELLAANLLEYETLTGEEVKELLETGQTKGRKIVPKNLGNKKQAVQESGEKSLPRKRRLVKKPKKEETL